MSYFMLLASAGEINNWLVVIMGVGTVFAGLLSIILICVITGAFCGAYRKKKTATQPAKAAGEISNRGEILAAVCAACAEEMGTDVDALKVISFKKIS